jgi:hypothetical protein
VAVTAESVVAFTLSVLILDVFIVSVVAGVLCIVLSTFAESELAVDIDDSFVPQLTVTSPKATAANNNFFIIFILMVPVCGSNNYSKQMIN